MTQRDGTNRPWQKLPGLPALLREPSPVLRWSLVALTAVLARACLAPFDLWPLAFVHWVPTLLAASRVGRLERSCLFGAAGGLATVLGYHFIPEALRETTGMPWVGSVALLLLLAVLHSAHFALAGLVLPPGTWGLCFFPLVLSLSEALTAAPLPWFQGSLLQGEPAMLQPAAWGGAASLAFLVGCSNAAFAGSLLARRHGPWLSAFGMIAALRWGGAQRIPDANDERGDVQTLAVGVVQTAFDAQSLRRTDTIAVLRALSLGLIHEQGRPHLLVWPESAETSSLQIDEVRKRAADYWFQDRRKPYPRERIDVPILLGVPLDAAEEGLRNSALLVSRLGAIEGRYDKRLLVPIGERAVSFGPWSFSATRSFSAGNEPAAMEVEGARLTVLSCVEDLVPSLVAEDVQAIDPDLLVSLSSGGWFSDPIASELHFQLSKLRAVESGRPLLRVANHGVSALIDPYGRTVRRLPTQSDRAVLWTVPLVKASTLQILWSPWVSLALLVALGCVGELWTARRRTRSPSAH